MVLQAPLSRLYEVQLVYTAIDRVSKAAISQKMLKVSASTQSISKLRS